MKTTLNLDGELLTRAKKLAAERGITLTAFMEQALRDALSRPKGPSGFVLDLPKVRGEGPPVVDPADRDALYEFMEREAGAG